MQASRAVEIWVGLFVAIGLIALFFVAMQVSNLGEFHTAEGSYIVRAHFNNIGGLRVRAPVSMAGVTVGRVEHIGFDEQKYEAVVEMRIDPAYKTLPEDTSASILTAGLLGEQYVGLSAGGSDEYLQDGDEIELTQSAMILEQLISRLLFNKAEEGKKSENAVSPPAPVSTPAIQSDKPATAKVASAPSKGHIKAVEPEVRKLKKSSSTASNKPTSKGVTAHDHRTAGHGAESRPKTARPN